MMRIVIAFSLMCGVAFFAPTVVSAAPLALSDHAALTKSVGSTSAGVEEARYRHKARRGKRYARRGCSTWTCKPYYRPYQYRYWQFYYPHGGPLFY